MSHAANVKKELSFTAIKALEQEWMGDNNLLRMLDNAGQAVVVPIMDIAKPTAAERLQNLAESGGRSLSAEQADAAIKQLYRVHARISTLADPYTQGGKNAPPLPVRVFHHFYSLIYHLIPEDTKYLPYKHAIIKAFEALDLSPPLAKEKVAKLVPEIIVTPVPEQAGRSHG